MLNTTCPVTTTRALPETELLRRVLAHDGRAWAELVRRYRPVIFRCITRILGRSSTLFTRADIEEVYAEVWMSLVRDDMRKLRLYDPARGAKLGSWVGLLAKNAAHDYIRVHGSRPIADTIEGFHDLDDGAATPLDDILQSERRERLDHVLAGCAPKDQEFFALYFGRGLTAEEIAREMRISVKTVYTKKHKLLTRLASHMAPV